MLRLTDGHVISTVHIRLPNSMSLLAKGKLPFNTGNDFLFTTSETIFSSQQEKRFSLYTEEKRFSLHTKRNDFLFTPKRKDVLFTPRETIFSSYQEKIVSHHTKRKSFPFTRRNDLGFEFKSVFVKRNIAKVRNDFFKINWYLHTWREINRMATKLSHI